MTVFHKSAISFRHKSLDSRGSTHKCGYRHVVVCQDFGFAQSPRRKSQNHGNDRNNNTNGVRYNYIVGSILVDVCELYTNRSQSYFLG